MSHESTERTAILSTVDLVFRAKLRTVLEQGGYRVVSRGAAPLAVIELGPPQAVARVRELVGTGTTVIAFGSHVHAELLREARKAGAISVPNSEVEAVLRRQVSGS